MVLRSIFFIFLGFCIAPTFEFAFAQRSTSISGSSSFGTSDYSEWGLRGRYGIDNTWQAIGSISISNTGGDSSKSASVGANAQWTKDLNTLLQLQGSREPNDLSSLGALGSIAYKISSFWEAERDTTLTVGLEGNHYKQGSSTSAKTKTPVFDQKALHLDLDQEILSILSVSAGLSQYRYTTGGSVINTVVNSRRKALTNTNSNAVAVGFPKNSYRVGLNLDPIESLGFFSEASKTKTIDSASATNTYVVGATLKPGQTGPTITGSMSIYKENSQTSKKYYSLGFGYHY